jgi:predicted nucleotidyltransferase
VKTSLSQLPAHKQQQLADVVATLCELAPIEIVILFGSHARGDWVDDPVGGYHSDFDVLVVVKSRKTAENHNLWNTIEERLRPRLGSTELSLIVHDIKDVTHQLEKGFYFFSEVKKEGIVLYDSQRFALAQEKERSPEERLEQARVWFADWFQAADNFLGAFEDAFAKGHWKVAAFQLHQATERYYNTTQLVFTAYKAKLHNIEELGRRVLNLNSGFTGVFPRDTKEFSERASSICANAPTASARRGSACHRAPSKNFSPPPCPLGKRGGKHGEKRGAGRRGKRRAGPDRSSRIWSFVDSIFPRRCEIAFSIVPI